ncbi:uncharacterized protein LOC114576645 [Exaiptasia diaphana]|uniref:Uncharacterized protein n=1 Tax=Exaiptasia diaphana TaxID=2652724 RepID=A0A913YVE4_EXADI|nr:uncharacterized protein LOC114576645 [Exaiptasia diaphana]
MFFFKAIKNILQPTKDAPQIESVARLHEPQNVTSLNSNQQDSSEISSGVDHETGDASEVSVEQSANTADLESCQEQTIVETPSTTGESDKDSCESCSYLEAEVLNHKEKVKLLLTQVKKLQSTEKKLTAAFEQLSSQKAPTLSTGTDCCSFPLIIDLFKMEC